VTLLAAAVLGLAIGAVLGALGGGGAILTVPILVFVLGQSAQDATTSSLVIIGVTAVIGALGHARVGNVRWRTGAAFGAAGILAAYAGTQANRHVDEHLLLLTFAGVMVLAATGMLTRRADQPPGPEPQDASSPDPLSLANPSPGTGNRPRHLATGRPPAGSTATGTLAPVDAEAPPAPRAATVAKVIAAGLLVGFLTGLFGVGGGFVIVPALVLALAFPMPAAVGTSLLIIAINSAASLAARSGHAQFDWAVIVPFTLAAVAGTFGGQRLARRVSGPTLTRAFAVLLLLVAAYVGVRSVATLL
jgi:uncharacterized protein